MNATKQLDIDGNFDMRRGRLSSPTIVYETWGTAQQLLQQRCSYIYRACRQRLMLLHPLKTPAPAGGKTWSDLTNQSTQIGTLSFASTRWEVASALQDLHPSDSATGKHYRLDFPVLCLEDIADTGALVLDHLGIEKLHTVVGASMGGMTALAFSLLHPERSQGLVSISSAARSLPFAIALRSLQREIIRKDPAWKNGLYEFDHPPTTGMQLARKLGMITYRSAQEWAERFGRERATSEPADEHPFGIDFEVESYLEAHAAKFIGTFDANCYLYLSRAMDLFDVADHGGSLERGVSRVNLERALIIGVKTDFLFPIHQQEELATALGAHVTDLSFQRLDSIQGHDSFLVDMDRFRPALASYF